LRGIQAFDASIIVLNVTKFESCKALSTISYVWANALQTARMTFNTSRSILLSYILNEKSICTAYAVGSLIIKAGALITN